MTSNLKSETLMNLPVLGALNDAPGAAKPAAPALNLRVGWLVPFVAVSAAIFAYLALSNLAELNSYLNELTVFMQSPQF